MRENTKPVVSLDQQRAVDVQKIYNARNNEVRHFVKILVFFQDSEKKVINMLFGE